MPPFNLRFHRLAWNDFLVGRRWYARRSASVAQRFGAAVDQAVREIEADPYNSPSLPRGYRACRVAGFPYQIIYRIESSFQGTAYAVAHAKRRPGYWHRRRP